MIRGQTRTLEGEWLPIWALEAAMGCGAERGGEASKARSNATQRNAAQRNTRNVRPADFPPGLASHHGSHGRPGRGRGTCPLSLQWPVHKDVGPVQASQTRGQRTEDKARRAPSASSLASLSQTSKPLALWKQHRRPNPRPAARNIKITRPAGTAAQPLPRSWQASIIKVSTMTLDPRPIPPRRRETLEAVLRIQGTRPWPALQSHPRQPRQAFSGQLRDQTSDLSDSSNLLGRP